VRYPKERGCYKLRMVGFQVLLHPSEKTIRCGGNGGSEPGCVSVVHVESVRIGVKGFATVG
jgi:hypothetical protein